MGLCCSLPTLYVDVQWVDTVFCLHCIWMFNGYMLFFAYTVCGCSMGICCSLPTLYVDVQWVYIVFVYTP